MVRFGQTWLLSSQFPDFSTLKPQLQFSAASAAASRFRLALESLSNNSFVFFSISSIIRLHSRFISLKHIVRQGRVTLLFRTSSRSILPASFRSFKSSNVGSPFKSSKSSNQFVRRAQWLGLQKAGDFGRRDQRQAKNDRMGTIRLDSHQFGGSVNVRN